MKATDGNLIAANATGCLEVFSLLIRKPAGSFHGSTLFSAILAAVGTGMAAAMRVKAKKNGGPLVRVLPKAVTAVLPISASAVCQVCSKEMMTSFMSATTTKAI